MFGVRLREQVLQDWNLRQSRDSTQRARLLVFQDAAHQVDFAFAQADFMFDLALSNDWLVDAADVGGGCNRRYVQRYFQRDLAALMHLRCDIDIHADIQVLELRVHQWVDTYAADAGLE